MSSSATPSDAPLVSILINNYNYAQYLEEAIESALAQDYANVEVIVVDDGSTDGSRELIARFGAGITTVNQSNSGQAAAFNAGFAACRGEIVCLLDADDRFARGKVAAIVAEYHAHPDAQWCFHSLAFFGERAPSTRPVRISKPTVVDARRDMLRGKLRLTAPATSGLTFRRRLLQQILPMPVEIRITSDNYLKFAALGTAVGVVSPASLAEQRIHGANAYTLLSSAESRRGNIALITAGHLADRFPQLRRFADGHFVRGFSACLAAGGAVSAYREHGRRYVARYGIAARARLATRVLIRVIINALPG